MLLTSVNVVCTFGEMKTVEGLPNVVANAEEDRENKTSANKKTCNNF